jgi:hypothetical protein
MSQTYTHTLLTADDNATGTAATHQDNFDQRTIYIAGTFSATVTIEVSPDASGSAWFTLLSKTAAGVYDASVMCKRIRASVSSYVSGSVTVTMVAKAGM